MFFSRLPKIILSHNFPFFKKASNPIDAKLFGIMVLFMAVGAFWLMTAVIRSSGLFDNSDTEFSAKEPYPPIRGEAFVQFDFSVKPSRAFRGSVIDGMTISETVQQAAVAGNFDVAWQPIVTIDGISDGMHSKRWVFYKNDTRIDGLPSKVSVKPQDEIFARFE